RHHELAARGELLHTVVLPVRDVDVALVVEGDAPRLVELPLAAAVPAALGQRLAVGGEDLQAVVAAVDDNHVAVGVADDPGRILQFSRTAGVPHLRMNLPAASKTETVFVHSSVTYTLSCLSTATPNGQMECPSVSPYVQNSASSSSSPGPPIFTRLIRIANVFSLPRLATKM